MRSNDSTPQLGSLERAIMEALWERDAPCLAREVQDEVIARRSDETRPAYATIRTVLDRLARKRLIVREPSPTGRALQYRAASSRQAYVAELMLSALDLSSDREGALIHFAEAVEAADASALRSGLARSRKRPRDT